MNRDKLLKLMKENPTLPIVFFTDEYAVCDDYTWTFRKSFRVEKSEIYEIDERICNGEDDALDYLSYYYSDCEEYANLSEEEYENVIKEKLKAINPYEAIVLWVS